MTWPTPPADADLGELAAILGRGYLRLTANGRNVGVSGPKEPQKEVDPRAKQSVTGVQESRHRRAQWT